MSDVYFKHGDPLMVDYTPGSAVTAGDVLVLEDVLRVAHLDIEASRKGALAAGGGVYEGPKASGDGGWSDGDTIYWNATTKKFTKTADANKVFGPAVGDAADTDTTARVQHRPN
jgi:predicted RecA/RadA family phage recombinase